VVPPAGGRDGGEKSVLSIRVIVPTAVQNGR